MYKLYTCTYITEEQQQQLNNNGHCIFVLVTGLSYDVHIDLTGWACLRCNKEYSGVVCAGEDAKEEEGLNVLCVR